MTKLQFDKLIASLRIATVNVPITKVKEELIEKLEGYISRRNSGDIMGERMISDIRAALDYVDKLMQEEGSDYELVHVDMKPNNPHVIWERTCDWIWTEEEEKQESCSSYEEVSKEFKLERERREVRRLKKQYEEDLKSLDKERAELEQKMKEMKELECELNRQLRFYKGIRIDVRDPWEKWQRRIRAFCRITFAIAILVISIAYAYKLIG